MCFVVVFMLMNIIVVIGIAPEKWAPSAARVLPTRLPSAEPQRRLQDEQGAGGAPNPNLQTDDLKLLCLDRL